VHRGQFLKKAVKASGISITTLIKRAGYSRTSYYNHIDNKDLPLDIIAQYGKALGIDFSISMPQIKELKNFIYRAPLTLEDAILEISYWKEKYYGILEKYNSSIEERLPKK
jgi:AcrR family transcriptional regulator